MESIDRISKIDKTKLSGIYFFQTLLEQGCLCGLISDSDIENIQFECLSILSKQTDRFNNGDSSSIRVETAQSLLASILYTIGLYLKTYSNPDDAIAALLQQRAETFFIKGLKQINTKLTAAKAVHHRIVHHLVNTPNIYYKSTIVDGINGFFKIYYPEFGAHEIHITADYPVFNEVTDLTGIEFIQKYIQNFYYENLLCSYFSDLSIHHLLYGFNADYKNLLFNIYEPILITLLGCVLTEKEVNQLELAEADVRYLCQLFKDKTTVEITQILQHALEKAVQKLSISSENLRLYLNESIYKIVKVIQSAASIQSLDKVFIIPVYPENIPIIKFSYGTKMENDLYCQLIEEITQSGNTADKIKIISERVHSLADFNDVLLDAQLSDEEISAVLKLLSPVEFAALLKEYPFYDNYELIDLKYNEMHICICLKSYMNSLPDVQKRSIEKLKINSI